MYKEDVYETEDLPCPEQNEVVQLEEPENPEVERIHLDMNGARKRFGNCILDSDGADFSDSISARRLKRGYKASEIFEAEPSNERDEEETFEQRYERLCREVQELVAEAEKRQGEVQNPKKADILALNEILKSVATKLPNAGKQQQKRNPQESVDENDNNEN